MHRLLPVVVAERARPHWQQAVAKSHRLCQTIFTFKGMDLAWSLALKPILSVRFQVIRILMKAG